MLYQRAMFKERGISRKSILVALFAFLGNFAGAETKTLPNPVRGELLYASALRILELLRSKAFPPGNPDNSGQSF